jgi:glycosyltransferase involved in cell wall biosynthesis
VVGIRSYGRPLAGREGGQLDAAREVILERPRILFCSQNSLDARLGAPKVILEAGRALQGCGWEVRWASNEEICPNVGSVQGLERLRRFSGALRRFLCEHAASFDVVDYDHAYLPFERSEFHVSTLFVARSVLLAQHFERIEIPRYTTFRSLAERLVHGFGRWNERRGGIRQADETFRQADLIHVSNEYDRAELLRRGFSSERILVLPFGLFGDRVAEFTRVCSPAPPGTHKVAFVGTFDLRKGAAEFPDIVERVVRSVPDAQFKLVGARCNDGAAAASRFPSRLQARLEIIPSYDPQDLPRLLGDCDLGVFPSHIEGFGFGVLEMLAAGLPVIAYDAPGPPMMLGPEWLVPRGDAAALADRVVPLLCDAARLSEARWRAWQRAREPTFSWEEIGRKTSRVYLAALSRLRTALSSAP